VSSLPEVGGDAAEYADPHDVDSIAGALAGLLTSEGRRAELAALGPQRAAGFTWERSAEILLETLRRVSR
jgi:alpha-1,3-rhamnosyl/mannosyltransferase